MEAQRIDKENNLSQNVEKTKSQFFSLKDNRPSQTVQAKMISVMQKKAVIQRAKEKISDLSENDQELVKMYFVDFRGILLEDGLIQSLRGFNLDLLEIESEGLRQSVIKLRTQIERKISDNVINNLSMSKKEVVGSTETTPEIQKASFDKVGIDGSFDMELSDKDVIVKVNFKLPTAVAAVTDDIDNEIEGSRIHIAKEAVNGVDKDTIEAIVRAWAKKDVFQKGQDKYSVKVHISIKGNASTEGAHYDYHEGTSMDYPASVLRDEKRFRVRRIGVDSKSAIHEFGHVLGLHEEYHLDQYHDKDTHHEWLLKKYYGKETYRVPATDKPADEETNTKSIMGSGDQIFGRHYIGVLNALCKLTETNFADWKILIPGEASES